MLVHASKFAGVTLNISGISVNVLNPGMNPSANPVYIEQAQADQDYSGAYTVDLRSVALQISITDFSNRYARINTIKAWFKRGTRGDLEATFLDDGLDYMLDCVVVTPPVQDKDAPNIFNVVLQTGQSAWRAVTAETSSWTVSGAGGTKDITVGGNDETVLSLDITPTAGPTTGYLYRRLYQLVNVPSMDYGTRAWCLTIDHAALVTGGKSQADGDDLRIWFGDTQAKRWLYGANTTTCQVWFNLPIPAGFSLVLKTAVPASGDITELVFESTTNTRKALGAMPASGILYHGNEWFYYSAKDSANYKVTGITRHLYGTTEEAHLAAVTFKFVGQAVILTYGNLTVGAPALDDADYDNDKPLFLLSSTNGQWDYSASSLFYDPVHPGRPGEWKQHVKRNALNENAYLYNVKGDAETGDPALGARAGNYLNNTVSKSDVLELGWLLYCAGDFSEITATGRKYRSSTLFLTKAAFQRSANGSTWYDLWNETTPTAAATYESWGTHSAVAVAAGSKYLRLWFSGNFAASPASAYAQCEGLTLTVKFASANLPTGTLLSEADNAQLTASIANNTNADQIGLDLPMLADKLLTLDGEARSAVFNGANAHRSISLSDESRSEWIRLSPGSNTIAITGTDIGTLSVTLRWYRRRLY